MKTLLRAGAVALALLVAAAVGFGAMLASFVRDGGAAERIREQVREATGRELAWDRFGFGVLPPRISIRDARLAGADAASPAAVEARTLSLHLAWTPLLARKLVVTSARLEGGTLRAAPFELLDVEAEARDLDATGAMRVTGGGRLANGTLQLTGDVTRDGVLALDSTLAGVDAAPFAPFFGRDLALAGRVDGSVRARGPASALDSLDADLEVADASVRAGNVSANGPVAVKARMRGAPDALHGDFELDATRAQLSAYGGAFVKPPGAPATASGKLVRDSDGKLGVDSVRLQIKNMNGTATGSPGAWRLDVAPFDVASFLGLARGPFELRGALRGDATSAHSEGAVATIGGQPVAVAWSADLAASPARQRLQLATQRADARALLAALAGRDDLLEGPLTLDASLAGELGGEALGSLDGTLDAQVGAGRIPDVSPLRAALDGLARYDGVVRVLDRKDADRALAAYLGDRFESLVARLDVAGGRARSRKELGWDALVLRYPGYRLELRGAVTLADQALDAKGRVVLEPALEAALAERPVEPGAEARVIEIAEVRGTLAEPKLRIDEEGAAEFAASLALAQRRNEWEREIDEKLGEGSGSALLEALDGFLGNKKKERR